MEGAATLEVIVISLIMPALGGRPAVVLRAEACMPCTANPIRSSFGRPHEARCA